MGSHKNIKHLKIISLSMLLTSMPIFTMASVACENLFREDIIEVIEGKLVTEQEMREINQSLVVANKNEIENQGRQIYRDFMALQRGLYNQVTSQNRILVNIGKEKTTEIASNAYTILRKFHFIDGVGLSGSRDHRVLIHGKLNYVGSESKINEKKKPIKIHKYLQTVSEGLKIYAMLVEETTAKGDRFDRFFIRLSHEDKKGVHTVDIPLVYGSYSGYQHANAKNVIIDEGITLRFNGDLKVADPKVKIGLSGISADLKLSLQNETPKDLLEVSIYITK